MPPAHALSSDPSLEQAPPTDIDRQNEVHMVAAPLLDLMKKAILERGLNELVQDILAASKAIHILLRCQP